MGCSKVCVATVGAAVVITLIAVPTAIYVHRSDSGSKRTYTFDDFYNDTIRYQTYSLRWISDNEYLHKSKDGNVYLHNVETMASSLYLSNSTFAEVDASGYIVSADRKFICFESNYSKQWRHSYTASYSIYNMETQAFVTPVHIPQVIQLLMWAPVENKLAYVWDYNIYLKLNATAEPIQITQDGKINQILNGVPDWAYEEEVFVSNEGMWWSPTAKYLAYVQINDTDVHAIEYSMYGNGQYPITMIVPYPKAGSNIPKARLFVVHAANPSIRSEVVVPKSIGAGDHYLSSVTWVTDERIAVQWLTRRQDQVLLQLYDYDGTSWKENIKFEQKSKTGWVGRYNPLTPYFAADNSSFYKVMSDPKGYKHLHYVKGVSCQILSGHSAPECLTCFLYKDRCQFNSAYFSQNCLKTSHKYSEIGCFYYSYAGPASQYVDYKFRLEWATYLCSTEDVIIASFDGRGSGFQGDEIMHAIYERLGTYEVEDQISAVRKFIDMGFIDKERIGMWGWSYGGYVTSMVLGSGSGLFKCGIAVAPVSKWEYYGRAKNFKSVQYLLVHGTADDNVHFQQAAQISKALVEQQVDFEAMWYTDKDHSLSGKARYHLYKHLSHFLQKCYAEKK
uniref:Uncharacterized protein n=1 Tax=Pygocentrus nattereri TaxID=42514 RepID=A0AAR2J2N7_PYGNA